MYSHSTSSTSTSNVFHYTKITPLEACHQLAHSMMFLWCYRSLFAHPFQEHSQQTMLASSTILHFTSCLIEKINKPGSCRPQMGPSLAPWTLLSGPLIQPTEKQVKMICLSYGHTVSYSRKLPSYRFILSLMGSILDFKRLNQVIHQITNCSISLMCTPNPFYQRYDLPMGFVLY